jgi:hypothetical protein
MSKKTIEKELNKLGAEYSAFMQQHNAKVKKIKEGYKTLYHKCVKCGKRSKLKDLVLLIEQYHDRHVDLCYDSEGRHIICPHCFTKNRFYNKELRENLVEETSAYLKVMYWLPHDYAGQHPPKVMIYGKEVVLEYLPFKNVK